MPPTKALAYGVVEGKYYLKLPKGQFTLLSKITRLSYKGVHLTSKKTMRAVITGESPLRLSSEKKEKKKVLETRKGGKRATTTLEPKLCTDASGQRVLQPLEPEVVKTGMKMRVQWPKALSTDVESLVVKGYRGERHGLLHVAVQSDTHYFCYLEHPDVVLHPDLLSKVVQVEPAKLKEGIQWQYDWEEEYVKKTLHPDFWL